MAIQKSRSARPHLPQATTLVLRSSSSSFLVTCCSILFFLQLQLLLKAEVVLVSSFSTNNKSNNNNNNNKHEVMFEVCQNKDCRKRWSQKQITTLPEILMDLLPPTLPPSLQDGTAAGEQNDDDNQRREGQDNVATTTTTTATLFSVERTGCLSQCGKGPNLRMNNKPCRRQDNDAEQTTILLQGITDISQLVKALEGDNDDDDADAAIGIIKVPSKLVAAATVMERAQKASSFADKDKFLSSVIRVLNDDESLCKSCAIARAYSLRSEARFEEGLVDAALDDATTALERSKAACASSSASLSASSLHVVDARAWRTIADCYKAQGNTIKAIDALQQWAATDFPAFGSKVVKEIQDLQNI